MAAPRPRRRRARGLLAAAGAVGLLATPAVAVADDGFTIRDPRVTESSGLARDVEAGCYWTVNDSGDAGRAYALDTRGSVLGSVGIRSAAVDVEAVALADDTLYLADIGDNRAVRSSVTVYAVARESCSGERTVSYRAYDFAYPDDQSHDAETFLLDRRGRMLVVTKGLQGGVYRAPERPSRTAVNRLERVADAPAVVTDGTVLPDGRIVLRTYGTVEVLDPETYALTASLQAPAQRQGESITVSLDGTRLLLGSEGARSTVESLPLPAAGATPEPQAPEAFASTPPVAADSAPPAAWPGFQPGLGWAGALAAAAGAAVVVARRR